MDSYLIQYLQLSKLGYNWQQLLVVQRLQSGVTIYDDDKGELYRISIDKIHPDAS